MRFLAEFACKCVRAIGRARSARALVGVVLILYPLGSTVDPAVLRLIASVLLVLMFIPPVILVLGWAHNQRRRCSPPDGAISATYRVVR